MLDSLCRAATFWQIPGILSILRMPHMAVSRHGALGGMMLPGSNWNAALGATLGVIRHLLSHATGIQGAPDMDLYRLTPSSGGHDVRFASGFVTLCDSVRVDSANNGSLRNVGVLA